MYFLFVFFAQFVCLKVVMKVFLPLGVPVFPGEYGIEIVDQHGLSFPLARRSMGRLPCLTKQTQHKNKCRVSVSDCNMRHLPGKVKAEIKSSTIFLGSNSSYSCTFATEKNEIYNHI